MSKLEERLMYMPRGYQMVHCSHPVLPGRTAMLVVWLQTSACRRLPGCSLTLCPQWRLAAPYDSC